MSNVLKSQYSDSVLMSKVLNLTLSTSATKTLDQIENICVDFAGESREEQKEWVYFTCILN